MQPYQRLAVVLLLSLLASCIVAPWAALGIDLIRGACPALDEALDFPFDRVMRRVVLIVSVLFLVAWRRRLEIVSLASVGLRGADGPAPLFLRGWLAGAGALAAMLLVMAWRGARIPGLYFSGSGELLFEVGKAFLTGVVVAIIEEIFFRGFVLQACLRTLPAAVSVVAMSAFFAIVHFFNASDMPAPAAFDPLLGFKALAYFFAPLCSPAEVLPGFVGLFLFGLLLGASVLRTGSLYLAMGLHAGCVFGIKAEGLLLNRAKGVAPWFFGDGRVVTGVFGWIVLLGLLWAMRRAHPAPRPRGREEGGAA